MTSRRADHSWRRSTRTGRQRWPLLGHLTDATVEAARDDLDVLLERASNAWATAGPREHLDSAAGVARALYGLGGMRYRARAYDAAASLLERALVAARRGGESTVEERSLGQLASLAEAQGRWSEARRRYAEVEEIAARLSHLHDVAHCQANQAAIAAIKGEHETAAELARSAMTTARRSGSTPALAFAEALAGVVALERGDGPTAAQLYSHALERCLEAGLQHWALDCLNGMASAAVLSEQHARAAALYAAVDRACAEEGIPVEPGAERESHERCRRRLWTPGLQHQVATATVQGQGLGSPRPSSWLAEAPDGGLTAI